jgi:hypothetical protein
MLAFCTAVAVVAVLLSTPAAIAASSPADRIGVTVDGPAMSHLQGIDKPRTKIHADSTKNLPAQPGGDMSPPEVASVNLPRGGYSLPGAGLLLILAVIGILAFSRRTVNSV